jgi:hypothetical protein
VVADAVAERAFVAQVNVTFDDEAGVGQNCFSSSGKMSFKSRQTRRENKTNFLTPAQNPVEK